MQPKSLQICGRSVPIVYGNIGDDRYADWDPEKKFIRCNTNKACHWNYEYLFHEIVHAILDLTGQADVIADSDKEEGIVKALQLHLWPLMRFRQPGTKSSSSQ